MDFTVTPTRIIHQETSLGRVLEVHLMFQNDAKLIRSHLGNDKSLEDFKSFIKLKDSKVPLITLQVTLFCG
jgi:hypothetical protein